MDRTEAIEIVDRTHDQYVEAIRTGICPACEQLLRVEEVEESELPPDVLATKRRAEEYLEQKTDRSDVEWSMKHLEDCTFYYYWERLPKFCSVMNIRVDSVTILIPKSNGQAWIETVPMRAPDPGDPPVPD
jgi:hypothetical protein